MIKLKITLIALLVMCGHLAFSQTKTVSGTVLDDTGAPLAGASVIVDGTNNGTQTDFDGNFTISASEDDTLVISYIGFVRQRIAVGGQSNIQVQMDIDSTELDEIVVVAYGSQSRAEVTGAISSVSSEELNAVPVATADQALQGRAAGITVVNTGSPGAAPNVRIRGVGSPTGQGPLYVIDGVISTGIGNLNPNDIESINVLKDASTAASYGSQAANGVVIVTTKRGKPGKVSVSLNSYTGFNYTTKRFDVLNTQQYLQYANEAFGVTPSSPLSSSGLNTNWQEQIFRSGIIQSHDMSVSGGGENSDFRISGSFLDQEGTIVETNYSRHNFRANSNFTLGKIRVGETLSLSFSEQNPERQGGGRSLIEHAIKAAPYLPVYNPNNLGGFQGPNSASDGQDADNPVRVQTLGQAENRVVDIFGNLYGEVDIFEGLTFRTQFGLQNTQTSFDQFVPSYNDDSEGGSTHAVGFATITKNRQNFRRLLLTNSLNYETTIADVHNIDVLLLAEKNDSEFEQLETSSQNSITNEVNQVSNDASNLISRSEDVTKIGYLARLNYNYDGRYLIAASIRRDGSSRFGPEKKWGTFPSIALGWNIAEENFLEGSGLSTLKLRGSYGSTGFDEIPNYQFTSTLTSNFFYPIGGVAAVGTTINGVPNPNVGWEEKIMTNVGIDFGFNNNQFTASVEYYNNTSDELLIQKPIPPTLTPNQAFIVENVGSSETKGFEITLGYNDFEGDFKWSADLNLATTDNEMKSLGLGPDGEIFGANFESAPISRIAEGESLFHFYGLVTDGIYQSQEEVDAVLTFDPGQTTVAPGDIRFKDLNGDGQINSDDRAVIGNPYPEITYGLNLSASYKNWDLNMFINGLYGNDIYNTNIYDLEGMPRLFNAGTGVLDRWTGPGTSNSIPRAGGAPQNLAISDRFVEDGSFTRLKNIALGYTFKEGTITDWVSKLRVYVSGQNLITITDYSGLDPEIGASSVINNSIFEYGIDRGTYPQPKSIILGLQANF
ncbi:MAG: TonB-dependent receptor [Sediminicola sp.]|tara:strand:+ start:121968 stop:124979 length:3012 start_codon:yes stop_codon:yes gene_type:complete